MNECTFYSSNLLIYVFHFFLFAISHQSATLFFDDHITSYVTFVSLFFFNIHVFVFTSSAAYSFRGHRNDSLNYNMFSLCCGAQTSFTHPMTSVNETQHITKNYQICYHFIHTKKNPLNISAQNSS